MKNDWDMFWVVRFTSLNGINVKSKIERERVKNIVDEKARKSEEGTESKRE